MIEALIGYRVIDVACGSGDAQTLCITDDDNVWSFGDGDYGKLGRGGSEGCKYPIKIDSLAGLGVCKVECGSQVWNTFKILHIFKIENRSQKLFSKYF